MPWNRCVISSGISDFLTLANVLVLCQLWLLGLEESLQSMPAVQVTNDVLRVSGPWCHMIFQNSARSFMFSSNYLELLNFHYWRNICLTAETVPVNELAGLVCFFFSLAVRQHAWLSCFTSKWTKFLALLSNYSTGHWNGKILLLGFPLLVALGTDNSIQTS